MGLRDTMESADQHPWENQQEMDALFLNNYSLLISKLLKPCRGGSYFSLSYILYLIKLISLLAVSIYITIQDFVLKHRLTCLSQVGVWGRICIYAHSLKARAQKLHPPILPDQKIFHLPNRAQLFFLF